MSPLLFLKSSGLDGSSVLRHLRRLLPGVTGCLFAVTASGRADAQSNEQIAAMGCRNAASARLRADYPGASDVSFTSAPRVTGRRRGEVQMRGEGQYTHGARRRFVYECAYRPHSAKTAVTLSFPDTVAKHRN